ESPRRRPPGLQAALARLRRFQRQAIAPRDERSSQGKNPASQAGRKGSENRKLIVTLCGNVLHPLRFSASPSVFQGWERKVIRWNEDGAAATSGNQDATAIKSVESKQHELLAGTARSLEKIGTQAEALGIETQPLGCDFKTTANLPGIWPRTLHALAPLGIVVLAVAHRTHQRHDVAIAIRIVAQQPVLENRCHLKWEAQD